MAVSARWRFDPRKAPEMTLLELQYKLVRALSWASGLEAFSADLDYRKRLDAASFGWRNLSRKQRYAIISADPELRRLKRRRNKTKAVATAVYVSLFGVFFYLTAEAPEFPDDRGKGRERYV